VCCKTFGVLGHLQSTPSRCSGIRRRNVAELIGLPVNVSGVESVSTSLGRVGADEFAFPGSSNSQMSSGPHQVAFAIRGPIRRADLPGLCEQACALLECPDSVIRCIVDAAEVDAGTVDALARLQVAARRRGCHVVLERASPALLELVQLMGLEDVLPAGRFTNASGV
jgi:ABC-type transporter Mla MlaB component